jgi:predicted nucleic acid-binding Zn ribbon protein
VGRPWTCLVCNRVVPEGAVRCREHGGEFSLTINAKSRII